MKNKTLIRRQREITREKKIVYVNYSFVKVFCGFMLVN
jgi:hypothetical protein